MASIFLNILGNHEGSKQRLVEINRIPKTRIVVTEDYARRVAARSLLHGKATLSEALATAEDNLSIVRDIGRISGYTTIPSSGLASSWWHRNISLQPDCKADDSFKEDYISCLHAAISLSSTKRDSICQLVSSLQQDRGKSVILIEGTDAALLAAMWEETNRITTDLYITPFFRAREGYSVSQLRLSIGKQCGSLSPIAWANLLFCLPMVVSAGLPPLLLMQYYYKDNPVCQLLEIIRDVANPIFKDGAIQLLSFVQVVKRLAELEEKSIQAIHARCAKDSVSGQNRTLVDLTSTPWDQFRLFYYMNGSEILPKEGIRKRVVTYLSGLIQLANIYQGKVEKEYGECDLRIADAPLVCDILTVLSEMGKVTQAVSLPTTKDAYASEVGTTRTINRAYPWFGKSCD
jgi:hypothetical protein